MQNPQRIGILGGSFDPIHWGHLIMAQEIAQKCSLSQVLFVPSPQPFWKKERCQAQHRCEMVRLAIQNQPLFAMSDIEFQREPPCYAIDTLDILSASYSSPLAFLIGLDNLPSLHLWHRWVDLLEKYDLVVAYRPGEKLELPPSLKQLGQKLQEKITANLIATSPIPISSSQVRQLLREQKDVDELVPLPVANYIREHGLYRS